MAPSPIDVRAMTTADYPAVVALWRGMPGVSLNESDTPEAVASFLARNPGLSAVAIDAGGPVVGAVLCGHDGRRGYLHHLAVLPARRGQGLGRRLVEFCFARLAREAIPKCNIFVLRDNEAGEAFWRRTGWTEPSWKPLQKRVAAAP